MEKILRGAVCVCHPTLITHALFPQPSHYPVRRLTAHSESHMCLGGKQRSTIGKIQLIQNMWGQQCQESDVVWRLWEGSPVWTRKWEISSCGKVLFWGEVLISCKLPEMKVITWLGLNVTLLLLSGEMWGGINVSFYCHKRLSQGAISGCHDNSPYGGADTSTVLLTSSVSL